MASGASLSQVGFRNHDRAVRCGRASKKFAKFVQVISTQGVRDKGFQNPTALAGFHSFADARGDDFLDWP